MQNRLAPIDTNDKETLIAKAILFLDELERRFLCSEIDTDEYWYWVDQYNMIVDFNTKFEISDIRIKLTEEQVRQAKERITRAKL